MPTATDFRVTATAFDALGQSAGYAHYGIGRVRDDTGVRGGQFAAAVERGLDITGQNLGRIMGRCAAEAAEARRRALVCDEYTRAFREYENRLVAWNHRDPDAPITPRPLPPARPANWAEVG